MKINNLKGFSAASIKALFGLKPKVLAEVLFLALPELEKERTTRLKSRTGRFIESDGRAREVKPYQKVLLCLRYLRHNTSHEVVGRLVGFSADSSENAFVEVLPVLKRLFPNEKWEIEQRYGVPPEKWSPAKVERVIVDSFETYVPRPSNKERQKRLYSGCEASDTP